MARNPSPAPEREERELTRGREIVTNVGPGTLRPGVGKLVQRSGKRLYCGAMTGLAFGYTAHPNAKDPKKTSIRFAGQFLAITADQKVLRCNELYVPSAIERTIKSALDIQEGTSLKSPVRFGVEIWCEPDQEGGRETSLGYHYGCYDVTPEGGDDPLLSLAFDTGLIERPAPALAAPGHAAPHSDQGDGKIDPETGEVLA